jgi:archaellum component FlaG (FlaF/FlaG flagellin family)
VNNTLFDNFGPFMVEDIIKYVNLSAKQFENRVNVLNVSVTDQSDQNAISINVAFSIINNPTVPLQLNIFLKRVR